MSKTSNELFAAANRDIENTKNKVVHRIWEIAVGNANDTIYIEKAANPVDFEWLVVGTVRSQLSDVYEYAASATYPRGTVAKAKSWFAARGIEA